MERWRESKGYFQHPDGRYSEYRELILLDKEGDDAYVVTITFDEGKVVFSEGCERHFEMTPDDAIAALQEAIDWIREKTKSCH